MGTDWSNSPFRKLYEHPSSSWLRLPCWVRGYGSEMLRIAERPDGRVNDTSDAEDICLRLRAHMAGQSRPIASEHPEQGTVTSENTRATEQALAVGLDEAVLVRAAVQLMLAQGYLELRTGGVYIANFRESQRNYEAARKAKQRQKGAQPDGQTVPVVPNVPDSPGQSGTVPQDERRSDQTKPPLDPPPAGGERDRRKRKVPIPEDWKPNEKHAEKARAQGLDLTAEAERFRRNALGKDVRWVDWNLAFHNWLDSPYAAPPRNGKPPGLREHEAHRADEVEERRRRRNNLLDDARAGKFGPKIQQNAETTKDVGKFLDRLEAYLAKPVKELTNQVGRTA